MNHLQKKLVSLVRHAAEMRVAGKSWDAISTAVKRTVETCRDWPRKYPELWSEAIATAEIQATEEAKHESMLSLRNLLRSEEEKTVQAAATVLFKATHPENPPPESGPVDDFQPLSQFLASLSHDERQRLLQELLHESCRDAAPTATSTEVDACEKRPE